MKFSRVGSVVHSDHNGGYVAVLVYQSDTQKATFWKWFASMKSAAAWRDNHKNQMPQFADRHTFKELKHG